MMKRTLSVITALMSFAVMFGAGRVQAQDLTATSANADGRFVHDTDQGPSQNLNRRWDGAKYDDATFDVGAHTGKGSTLLDFDVDNIRSTEESGNLDLSLGQQLLIKGDFSRLTHRDGYIANGMTINNNFLPSPYVGFAQGMSTGTAAAVKRDFQEEEIVLSLSRMSPYRLYLGQWEQHVYGNQGLVLNDKLYSQGMSNYNREIYGGIDADLSAKSQAYYEYGFRRYVNTGEDVPGIIIGKAWKDLNYQADTNVTNNKFAFKYNPYNSLSFAGSVVTRSRYNEGNGLTQNTYAGNLSSSYRPTKNLSMTARLYDRGVQTSYESTYSGNTNTPAQPIDFLFLNGDFDIRYTGLDNIILAGGYRPSATLRNNSNAWAQVYPSTGFLNGGVYGLSGGVNAPAGEDTRHNISGKATFELPQNVELELSENMLRANAAAYENTPTQSYAEMISLIVPLPQNVIWMGSAEQVNSKNTMATFSNFTEKKDTLLTSLTWSDSKGRGSLGLNYAFENGVDSIDAYWSATSGENPASGTKQGTVYTAVLEPSAPYKFTNHVVSASAMLKPTSKFRINGNASYTDSQGLFSTQGAFNSLIPSWGNNAPWVGAQYFNATDTRILHLGLDASYQLCKFVSARGGINYNDWVDRVNNANDGRNTVYNVGVDYKF
ncbi:MAG: hypothetical protein ACHQ49_01775 [Elusimicrobiota bacterium]